MKYATAMFVMLAAGCSAETRDVTVSDLTPETFTIRIVDGRVLDTVADSPTLNAVAAGGNDAPYAIVVRPVAVRVRVPIEGADGVVRDVETNLTLEPGRIVLPAGTRLENGR